MENELTLNRRANAECRNRYRFAATILANSPTFALRCWSTALQVQVQEVYTHMVQQSKVITITGKPGIGKTEVGDMLDSSLVKMFQTLAALKVGQIRFTNHDSLLISRPGQCLNTPPACDKLCVTRRFVAHQTCVFPGGSPGVRVCERALSVRRNVFRFASGQNHGCASHFAQGGGRSHRQCAGNFETGLCVWRGLARLACGFIALSPLFDLVQHVLARSQSSGILDQV